MVGQEQLGALDRAIERESILATGDAGLLRELRQMLQLRLSRKSSIRPSNGGPIQRLILGVMVDGKARTYEAMSAAIAVKFGRRIVTRSIHAAVSGMVKCGERHWLKEGIILGVHQFTITDRGREIYAQEY